MCEAVCRRAQRQIKALAHTAAAGGECAVVLPDRPRNSMRALAAAAGVRLDDARRRIADAEMARVFNCGLGMVAGGVRRCG
jgi:phosphoribosylaminoimidazole (AIR) synthetase